MKKNELQKEVKRLNKIILDLKANNNFLLKQQRGLEKYAVDAVNKLMPFEHISIRLEEENEEFAYLRSISFYKAIDFEDIIILVIGKKDKIKFTPKLITWINETYEIDGLILIEKSNKPRPVVEALIAPFKLVSLNEIFLATGDIQFRAVLWEADKESILFTTGELEELILELTGSICKIEYQL